MVKRDDWGKIILDREGLRLLGSALFWRQDREAREAAGWAEADRKALSDDPRDWVSELSLERSAPNAEAKARDRDQFERWMHRMFGSIAELREVDTLRIRDFRFRWWHLIQNQILIPSLKDNLPSYGLSYERIDPIVELGSDLITTALDKVMAGEIRRLEDGGEDEPYPGRGEVLFAVSVSDICSPPSPRKKGRPQGSSFEDKADKEFVEDVVARVEYGEENVSEAVRLAIEGAEVVSKPELWRPGKLYETSKGQAARRIRRKVDAELKVIRAAALSQ